MARILFGWELGAGRGHLVRMADLAARLAGAGHEIFVATQNISNTAQFFPVASMICQAPIWPRLLINVAKPIGAPPATLGDILLRMGLDEPDILPGLIRAWDALFRATQPDIVVSDYAPALLCAARGRIQSIAVGDSFISPPAHLAHFPSLSGEKPVYDEAAQLDIINRGLHTAGMPILPGFPAIFTSDHSLIGTFPEIDCYRENRTDTLYSPMVAPDIGEEIGGRGEEIFVYCSGQNMVDSPLWAGLAKSALPVRIYGEILQEKRDYFTDLGFQVEMAPVPFDQIARQSRLVISHGGHGFVCSALLAGIPQVVTHYDLEKQVHGDRIMRLELGGQVPIYTIKTEPFATSLIAMYNDDRLNQKCREAAPTFRAQMGRPIGDALSDIVAEH